MVMFLVLQPVVFIFSNFRCLSVQSCFIFLPTKLLKQGYRYQKRRNAFSKFYRRHFALVSKYNLI